MAGNVKMVVTAEVAQAVGAIMKLVGAQSKAEQGFGRVAAGATKAEQAQTRAIQRMVGNVQARTRTAGMALSHAEKGALRMGLNPGEGAMGVAIARRLRSQDLRDDRGFKTFIRDRNVRQAGRAAGDRISHASLMSRADDILTRSASRRTARADHTELVKDAQLEHFGAGMDARHAKKAKALDTRNQVAQGALAVGAAVTGLAAYAGEELNRFADTIVATEDQMAGLYGVGGNPGKRGAVRAAALSTSIGAGMSLERVADLRGRMESAFDEATIPVAAKREAERAAIQYSKLGAKDATSTSLGLGALYTTFGKDLGGGQGAMRLLSNRLAKSADVGAFDPDTVTPYLAMIGQSFKGAGYTSSDMFAATAMASKTGMRPEAFATGTRNLSLLMMEGERKGTFKRSGDFGTDMDQLSKMKSPELLETFGRDTFVIAKMFADNNGLLKQYIADQQQITAKMDVLGQKIGQMMTDGAFTTAETIKSAKALQDNAAVIQSQTPGVADAVSEWEIRKAGAAVGTSPMMSWFKQPSVWAETAMAGITGGGASGSQGQHFRLGLSQMIADKTAAGDVAGAGYLKLKYGADSGTKIGDRFTGEGEAKDFLNLRSTGYDDLSAGEYTEYKRIGGTDAKAGQAYLERVGKSLEKAADNLSAATGALRQQTAGRFDTNTHN